MATPPPISLSLATTWLSSLRAEFSEEIGVELQEEMGAEEMGSEAHIFQKIQHSDTRPGQEIISSTLTDGLEPVRFGICGSKRPARSWSRKRRLTAWNLNPEP